MCCVHGNIYDLVTFDENAAEIEKNLGLIWDLGDELGVLNVLVCYLAKFVCR